MATTDDPETGSDSGSDSGTHPAGSATPAAGPEKPLVENSHVVMTPGTCGGKPRIAGTRIRVRDVVEWTDRGQSPSEIVAEFPQLSLGDVHGALAFYHDNRAFVDRLIREDDEYVERMMREAGPGLLAGLGFDPNAPERVAVGEETPLGKSGA